MKKFILFIALSFILPLQASETEKETAVLHMKIADVTSLQEATKIFQDITADFKHDTAAKSLDLHKLHMTTYTLEKSIAYFAENLKGEEQNLAQKIAVVVEDIHINSENNRQEITKNYLNEYVSLAEKLNATL